MCNFSGSKFFLNLEVPTHPKLFADFFLVKRFGHYSCSNIGGFAPFFTFLQIFAIFSTFCAFSQPLVDGFSNRFFVLKAEVSTLPMVSTA